MPEIPAELFDAPAPVISVYLTTAGARPDAAEHVALRWKSLRRGLADDGANGYCARPLQTDCIHPNFCYGCSQFASDVTFLPVLRGQRDRARAIRDQCVEEGREKWVERNDRDIAALEPIITHT